jgi:hypothetical protein
LAHGAAWSTLRLFLLQPTPPATWARKPIRRLPERAANARLMDLRHHEMQSKILRSNHADSTSSTPPSQSPLDGIADLFEKLPTEVYIELARCLLPTASSLRKGEIRQGDIVKAVILFIAEYGIPS